MAGRIKRIESIEFQLGFISDEGPFNTKAGNWATVILWIQVSIRMEVQFPLGQNKPPITAPAEKAGLLSSRNFFIAAAVLWAGILIAYLPALNFQFILDDHRFCQ